MVKRWKKPHPRIVRNLSTGIFAKFVGYLLKIFMLLKIIWKLSISTRILATDVSCVIKLVPQEMHILVTKADV